MSKTLIVPAATPYAEALLLNSESMIEKDMIKILEILNEVEQLDDYFTSPRIDVDTKKKSL
jgi:F0F1-type ATP synthase delta subunit